MDDNKLDKSVKAFLRKQLSEYMGTIGCITAEEKKDLLEWVKDGYSVYSNPYNIAFENGWEMDYINGCRFAADMAEEMMNPDRGQLAVSQEIDLIDGVPF